MSFNTVNALSVLPTQRNTFCTRHYIIYTIYMLAAAIRANECYS